jgi:hypothetical protein
LLLRLLGEILISLVYGAGQKVCEDFLESVSGRVYIDTYLFVINIGYLLRRLVGGAHKA